MASRESTNAKLASIAQSTEEDQDEEEQFRLKEKKAKQRLQRARLYNGGARYAFESSFWRAFCSYYSLAVHTSDFFAPLID